VDQPIFGGGSNVTLLHPAVLIAMILAIVLILVLPRKYAVIPFLLLTFLGAVGQQIYVGGVHLFVLRILIFAAFLRFVVSALSRQKPLVGGWNSVDTVFTIWAVSRALAFILLNGGESGAVVNQVSFVWESLGGYLVMRFFIQDQADIIRVIKVFATISVVLALTMLIEKFRAQNIFGYLGALSIQPEVREGSVRAQGAFAHPILAGVFATTLVPLFIWLWQGGKSKTVAVMGFLGSTTMMLTTASSTPLLAYLAGFAAICFWPFRKGMRTFRWGLVAVLIGLHLVMKSPVWFLISRVDVIAGNSGYHRAMLIDQCIRHFTDWWLIGTNAAGTWGWDMWDLSNQFVAEAETGGLLTVICFILVISRSFGRIGKARKAVEGDRNQEWLLWCLGSALFAHTVGYFGVSYFDHTKIAWFALLASIAAATAPILAAQAVPALESEGPLIIPQKAVSLPSVSHSSQKSVLR
jgi:hypothetical protein